MERKIGGIGFSKPEKKKGKRRGGKVKEECSPHGSHKKPSTKFKVKERVGSESVGGLLYKHDFADEFKFQKKKRPSKTMPGSCDLKAET